MKATIDVPEALYRRVKARAAMDGRAVREVTVELYERWLSEQGSPEIADASAQPTPHERHPAGPRAPMTGEEWLDRWEDLGLETARKAADPRGTVEIVLSERR